MSAHLLFVNNMVVGITEWRDVGNYPIGTYGYTPHMEIPWFITREFLRWQAVSIEDVPKEFRVHLMLLGVG